MSHPGGSAVVSFGPEVMRLSTTLARMQSIASVTSVAVSTECRTALRCCAAPCYAIGCTAALWCCLVLLLLVLLQLLQSAMALCLTLLCNLQFAIELYYAETPACRTAVYRTCLDTIEKV